MLVDVLAQLLLLAHNARAGVAEDRAADSGKSADLDSSEDTDRPAEAHAHEGPDHGQASHGDGGVVVVGVVVLHLLPRSRLGGGSVLKKVLGHIRFLVN